MNKTADKRNEIENESSLECLFSILDKRVDLARKRAEQNISLEEQEEYQKHHKTEIEYGIEFPLKGMKEDLKSDPEYMILCYTIGVCYFEAKKFCEAKKWFIRAIESTPEDYTYDAPYVYLGKITERKARFSI
jgi:tetratricopeptide (TPR) repeat protein